MLKLVGAKVTVITINGKSIEGILDSFCMIPNLTYIIIETADTIEIFNFALIERIRYFREPET